MSTKTQIDTNTLKVGSGATSDAKVGSSNVKYMSVGSTTVFDRVDYEFDVIGNDTGDGIQYHSSAGGSVNVSSDATVFSTKTHGNGVTENVSYSPTSVSYGANTSGSSYTTSQTITQSGSGLTKTFTWGVSKSCICNNAYGVCSCYGYSGCTCNSCYSQSNCSCNNCNSADSTYATGCSCNSCYNKTYSTSCTCNNCDSADSTYSTSCTCNNCNSADSTYATGCSCNACVGQSYSTSCTCNSCADDSTYTDTSNCLCNKDRDVTGYCVCHSSNTEYCPLNGLQCICVSAHDPCSSYGTVCSCNSNYTCTCNSNVPYTEQCPGHNN